MIGKFVPVVISQRDYPGCKGFVSVNDGLADGSGDFVFHLDQNFLTTFALYDQNNGALMASPNDGVAFPVTNRLAGFNLCRTLMNRTSVRDLTAPSPPIGITFPFLLLSAQAAPKITALGFVGLDILIKRFVAHRHQTGYLLRAPLLLQKVGTT